MQQISTRVVGVKLSATQHLIRSVLTEFDEDFARQWDAAFAAGKSADESLQLLTVNGAQFPVIRLGWRQVGDWFATLYRRANQQFFADRLPTARLLWNRRFRAVGGRIQPESNLIEMSAAHFEACGVAALGAVLIHEQVHYSLFIDRMKFGHTAEFRRRSALLGLPDIRHEMPLPARLRKPSILHRYRCPCGRQIESLRKFRRPRACAACCMQHSDGRFDKRFQLRLIESIVVRGR